MKVRLPYKYNYLESYGTAFSVFIVTIGKIQSVSEQTRPFFITPHSELRQNVVAFFFLLSAEKLACMSTSYLKIFFKCNCR
jgi:hypothetical protein